MPVINNPAAYLLSGAVASGIGSVVMDTRACANYGYLVCEVTVASARVVLEGSHDQTGWLPVSIVTAVAATATAQIAGYFPYLRAGVTNRYGAATANVHYSPGLI